MLATRVGYAGGIKDHPTYHDLGDHREAVEVTFVPSVVSYDELLDVFWSGQPNHIPSGPEPRVHLAILPIGPAQLAAAERSKSELRRHRGETVFVDIVPDPEFWPAERMHQKFTLQRSQAALLTEWAHRPPFVNAGDPFDALMRSTAAARLNAWLGPYGNDDDLVRAAADLGIHAEKLRGLLDGSLDSH